MRQVHLKYLLFACFIYPCIAKSLPNKRPGKRCSRLPVRHVEVGGLGSASIITHFVMCFYLKNRMTGRTDLLILLLSILHRLLFIQNNSIVSQFSLFYFYVDKNVRLCVYQSICLFCIYTLPDVQIYFSIHFVFVF